jgi:hypothetical protein
VRYFKPLQLRSVGDLALEPAERLGRHAGAQEADNVQAEHLLGQLVDRTPAAAFVDPGEHLVGVAAEHRTGAKQRGGLVLAVPVDRHGMGGVDGAVMAGVLHRKRANDCAGGQQFDLHATVGHFVDVLDILRGHFLEHVRCRPGRLHLERFWRLCENRRRGERRSSRRAAEMRRCSGIYGAKVLVLAWSPPLPVVLYLYGSVRVVHTMSDSTACGPDELNS